MRTVAIVLPGLVAAFSVDDIGGAHLGVTDASGYREFPLSNLTVTRVTVTADGYQPYAQNGVQVPATGSFQFRIGVPADPTRPQDVLLPALVPLALPAPYLRQVGNDFVDVNGHRVVYPGVDGFDDLWFATQDRTAELDALMAESVQLKLQVRRIWCMGDAGENQVFSLYPQNTPHYLDTLRALVVYENGHGIIPLFTAFVDAQIVMPDGNQRLTYWADIEQALLGSGAYLVSAWNQASKNGGANGIGPAQLPALGHGVIWSRGSEIEDTELSCRGAGGDASASELHATRNSFDRALMDTTASPPTMRLHGASMVWMTEGNPFGDAAGYLDQQAWALGRGYSILWALAIYHNRQSQRGLLMTDDTARCAAAWVQGMRM